MADHFNSFFTTVASSFADRLPVFTGCFSFPQVERFSRNKYLEENIFSLLAVSTNLVRKLIFNMNVCKTTVLENLLAKFIKDYAPITVFSQHA